VRRGGLALPHNTIRRAARTLALRGKVFVQQQTPGLASLHFVSASEAFVSYESKRCSAWQLDDGSPLPPRKVFAEVSYDPEERRFRGLLSWEPTSFCGDQRWEYDLIFDKGFLRIVDGRIHHYTPGLSDRGSPGQFLLIGEKHDPSANIISYESWLPQDRASTGSDFSACGAEKGPMLPCPYETSASESSSCCGSI